MGRLSTYSFKITSLALAASHAWAAPVDQIMTAPPAPSLAALLEARQAL
jgi:hypothetical protein